MKNNPYVGPRPYERGDRHNFYGRNREARELRALIVAEREVLFYAQSGAGKTSLLNAMVIPALEEKRFLVLPVARVGSDLPPEIEPEAVDNVFSFGALLTLAQEETPPEALLGHTLLTFLEEYYPESASPKPNTPLVLIFDQFEELFTTHRDRWQEADGFFRQVREALDALPRLGVVFAMREDYVAALDPYAPLLPRRLRARFRMERLGPNGARAAVEEPARNAGHTFAPDAAEHLVDDLRRIKVQRYAGAGEETVAGPFVEPVQLQVVCHQMWENLPEQPDHVIKWKEVARYGNIDRALTDFYELSLAQVIQKTDVGIHLQQVGERRLRRWFDEQLITPMQTRGLVMQGREETAGLPNAAVSVLEKRHLIRADVRAGARWYELTHDRFIEPIQESNKLWNEKSLRSTFTTMGTAIVILVVIFVAIWTVWQRAEARTAVDEAESEMWTSVRWTSLARNRIRPLRPGLSVSGVNGTAGTLGAFVQDAEGAVYLLSASEVLGPPGLKQDSLILQPGRTDGGQVPYDMVGYSALNLPLTDGVPMANMVGMARLNKSGSAFETSIPGIGPIRGIRRDPPPGTPVRMLGRTSGLVTGKVMETGITMTIYVDQVPFQFVNGVTTSPMSEPGDGGALIVDAEGYAIGILVAGSLSETILAPIQDVLDELGVQLVFPGQHLFTLEEHGPILSAGWLPGGVRIVTGGQDGVAHLWNVQEQETEAMLYGHEGAIAAVAVGPDGRWLVTGGEDATARIWDLTAPDPSAAPTILRGHELGVTSIAVGPAGRWLATGSQDTTVRLWDLTAPGKVPASIVLRGHESGVAAVAISPDVRWLAAGSHSDTVLVWDLTNLEAEPIVLHPTGDGIVDVTFHSNGSLVSTGANAQVVSWNVGNGEKLDEFSWPIETEQISNVAWSPDETQVIVVSSDGLATICNAANGEPLFALREYADVLHAVWSPDGLQIVTAGRDGAVRVWQGK